MRFPFLLPPVAPVGFTARGGVECVARGERLLEAALVACTAYRPTMEQRETHKTPPGGQNLYHTTGPIRSVDVKLPPPRPLCVFLRHPLNLQGTLYVKKYGKNFGLQLARPRV